MFGAVTGLLWLSTVPPTSALVALMFGTRWLAMLFGFAFFSHQVGGFLGVWLGGILFERTGSYDVVWWLSVALRRRLGADQPADRREAGRRAGRRAGLRTLRAPVVRATNLGRPGARGERGVATFKAIRIDKGETARRSASSISTRPT